jgi:hypothetical protein
MLNQFKNFNIYFLIFVSFIFSLAVFYLYLKQSVANDSTISEYLINYQGGFTRRGLIGEISFQLASFLDLSLRFTIFLIQSTIYFIFLSLTYFFIKNLPNNILSIIAIFSPVFLLYPIAEIEVLVRKEIFLFVAFIIFLNISNIKFSKNIPLIYIFLIFPIVILIWEPSIFFFPFIAFIILINNNNDSFTKILTKIILSFSSSIFVSLYIIFNLLSYDGHELMKISLLNNFGETCYMSCALLGSKSTIQSQFDAVNHLFTFTIFFRYFLIIIISFLPLFILFYNSKIKEKNSFFDNSNNLLIVLLILLIPVLILFSSATDWGRWVNISYTFSIFLYLYLYKNKLILINNKILFFDNFYRNRKKIFIILFIIFAFCWNPKTSMRGDVATNSLYKIIYNTSKKVFKFNGVRLFQDSTIMKLHQKYIE